LINDQILNVVLHNEQLNLIDQIHCSNVGMEIYQLLVHVML
jgi:hypothetical protein